MLSVSLSLSLLLSLSLSLSHLPSCLSILLSFNICGYSKKAAQPCLQARKLALRELN
jgi:hypothetical protein